MQQGWRLGLTRLSGSTFSAYATIYYDYLGSSGSYYYRGPWMNLVSEYYHPSDYQQHFRTGEISFDTQTFSASNDYLSGINSCCRVSYLYLNRDDYYRVFVGISFDFDDVLASPILTGVPVMTFDTEVTNTFFIPIVHVREFFCEWATGFTYTGMEYNPGLPSGQDWTMATTGEFNWYPAGSSLVDEWFAVQIRAIDLLDQNVYSVYDWLINVRDFDSLSLPSIYASTYTSTDASANIPQSSPYYIYEFSATFSASITTCATPNSGSEGVGLFFSKLPDGSTITDCASGGFSADGVDCCRTLTWAPTERETVDIIWYGIATDGLMGALFQYRINCVPPPPDIQSITPTTGPSSGTLLTLYGLHFGTDTALDDNRVTVGGMSCKDPYWGSDYSCSGGTCNTLYCTTPETTGSNLPVVITVSGKTSDTFYFSVNAHTISYFSPTVTDTNPAGITFEIVGTNFGILLDDVAARVGGVDLIISSVTHTLITASAPYGAGTDLSTTVELGSNNVSLCCYDYNPPTISSHSAAGGFPTSGATDVTIYGTNFGSSSYDVTAYLDSTECSYNSGTHSHNIYVCTLPAGSGTKTLTVVVEGQTSNSRSFSYDAPVITSTNPSSLATGSSTLTLYGSNFGDSSASLSATLGTVGITVNSFTQSQVVVSFSTTRAITYSFYVTASGRTGAGYSFTFSAPALSTISPQSESTGGGSTVVITGTSFGISYGTSNSYGTSSFLVLFGSTEATVVSSSDTTLTVTLPAGQGDVVVSVEVDDVTGSNTLTYTYGAVSVTSLTPTEPSCDETLITILGTNFGTGEGSTVSIDGTPCDQGVGASWAHDQVVCLQPASNGGENAVLTITVAGNTDTFTFDFTAPIITGVTADDYSTAGTGIMTVTGSSFGLVGNPIYVNGVSIAPLSWSQSEATLNVPVGYGTVDVKITNGARDSNIFTFTYADPVLTLLTISDVPMAGGTTLTLDGTSFDTSGTVHVGSSEDVCWLQIAGGSAYINLGEIEVYDAQGVMLTYNTDFTASKNGGWPSGGDSFPIGNCFDGDTTNFCHTWTDGELTIELNTCQKLTRVIVENRDNCCADRIGEYEMTFYDINDAVIFVYDFEPSLETYTIFPAFGGVCTNYNWDHSQITCDIPSGLGTVSVYVETVRGVISNILTLQYNRPVLTTYSPSSLSTSGGLLTLTGEFGEFGYVYAGQLLCLVATWGQFQVTCTVQPLEVDTTVAGGHGGLVITAGGRTNSGAPTVAVDVPNINALASDGNTDGTGVLTITGSSFGAGSVLLAVYAGENVLSVTSHDHTQIICTLAEGQGTVEIVVYVLERASNSMEFEYGLPFISDINPSTNLAQGDLVTITGRNFGLSGYVQLASYLGIMIEYDHSQIIMEMPSANGQGLPVIVVVGVVESNSNETVSYETATITSVEPAIGSTAGGDIITVHGYNFGNSAGGAAGTVYVNFVNCLIAQDSDYQNTYVICTLPPGSGFEVDLVVTTSVGSNSNAFPFSYQAPTITDITPHDGTTAGLTVTISGTSFSTAGDITVVNDFDGASTTCFVQSAADHSDSEIRCLLSEGYLSATITVSIGGSGHAQTATHIYTYGTPVLTSISPSVATTNGGTSLQISGSNLGIIGTATIDGAACTPVGSGWGHSIIQCTLPAGQGANVPVLVESGSLFSNTLNFSYALPTLTSVTCADVWAYGGTEMTLTGTNFGPADRDVIVTVGSWDGVVIVSKSQTQVIAELPSYSGTQNVFVTVEGQNTGTKAITYVGPTVSSTVTQLIGCPNDFCPPLGDIILTVQGENLAPLIRWDKAVEAVHYYRLDGAIGDAAAGTTSLDSTGFTLYDGYQCTGTTDESWPSGSSIDCQVECVARGCVGFVIVYDGGYAGHCYFRYGTLSTPTVYTIDDRDCYVPTGDGVHGTVADGSGTATYIHDAGHVGLQDGIVSLGSVADFGTGDFSGAVWMRPDSIAAGGLMFHSDGTDVGWELRLNIDQTVTFACGASTEITSETAGQFTVGDWHLIIFVKDGTSLTLYSRTASDTEISVIGSGTVEFIEQASGSPPLTIGQTRGGVAFDGALDDIAFFDRALSSIELRRVSAAIESVVSVDIAGSECPVDVTTTHDYSLECVLPAGTGFDLVVTVTVSSLSDASARLKYQIPTIYEDTVALASGRRRLLATDVPLQYAGGASVSFEGIYFPEDTAANLQVEYYRSTGTGPVFSCTPNTGTSTSVFVECEYARGFGADLRFRVYDGIQWGPLSDDSLYYPAPVISADSLRLFGGANPGAGLAVVGLSTEGDRISLNVDNTADFPLGWSDEHKEYIQVFYGTVNNPLLYECTNVEYTYDTPATFDSISCDLQPGEGNGYLFTVFINGQSSAQSTDNTYNYPAAPVINSVTGCPGTDGNATTDCPTAGTTTITITGDNFPALGLTIYIDGIQCPLTSITTEVVECTLPEGTGKDLEIYASVVDTASSEYNPLNSRPKKLLSYKNPSFTSILGCAADDVTTTRQCVRTGGDILTIVGENFGAFGAVVLVCGVECTNLQHDATTPHELLTCTTPPGSQLDIGVTLSVGGQPASNFGSISYAQCGTGYYQATEQDYDCTSCVAGTYTELIGQTICSVCASGRFQSSPAQTSCTACVAGRYSVRTSDLEGPTDCVDCLAGTYTLIAGQSACLDCDPGTYQGDPAMTECIQCATGTATAEVAAQSCDQCPAGTFAQFAGSVSCEDCAAGSYSAAEASTCTACETGKYQPNVRTSECIFCAAGSAIAATGQAACILCDPGAYAATTGLSSCLLAEPGYYAYGTVLGGRGATAQVVCATGHYSTISGVAACTQCRPGSSQPATGQQSCTLCAVGRIQDGYAQPTCDECDPGRYIDNVGETECNACAAGYYAPDAGASVCIACGLGNYSSNTGSSVCTRCAAGRAVGLEGQATCVDCELGYFAINTGQSTCDICVAGRYAPSPGTDNCTDALPGEFVAAAGQSVATDCEAGYYSSTIRAIVCTRCDYGTYQPDIGSMSCLNCSTGRYGDNEAALTCVDCLSGSAHNLTGQVSCPLCVAGEYQPDSGEVECLVCPSGFITESPGLTACSECPTGSYNPSPGQSECILTDPGYYQDEVSANESKACPAGEYQSSSGQPNCVPCEVGRYAANPSSAYCDECTAGRYSEVGSTECLICPVGTYSLAGAAVCTDCAQGRYVNTNESTTCINCAAGYSQPAEGETACVYCSQGRVQPLAGQATCNICPAGRQGSEAQRLTCEQCTPGYYSDEAGSVACALCAGGRATNAYESVECSQCLSGTYAAQGSSTCSNCQTGKYSATTGSVFCLSCGSGRYQSAVGSVDCVDCAAGSYSTGSAAACSSCTTGHYCPVASTTPLECEPGSYQSALGQSACLGCPVGYYNNDTGSVICTACAAGYYASSVGSLSCTACAEGTYASAQATVSCQSCASGSFSNTTATTVCDLCLPGKFSASSAQIACTDCAVGSFSLTEGLTQCTLCAVGYYAPNISSQTCAYCPVGRYAELTGRSQCTLCDLGRYGGSVGLSTCVDCESGFYTNTSGESECFACPTGTFSEPTYRDVFNENETAIAYQEVISGPIFCQDCTPGFYQSSNGQTDCSICDAGSYSNQNGTSICPLCEAGRYQPAQESTDCLDCPVGYYRDTLGAVVCNPCPTGEFMNGTGAQECTRCPTGRYQDGIAQTDCIDCPVGTYANSEGLPECIPCEHGQYNNMTGQVVCLDCPITMHQPAYGAEECLDCPAGKYGAVEGLVDCTECETGSYQANNGTSGCDFCGVGTFQDTIGSTDCKSCPNGTFGSQEGLTTCTPCDPGSFTNSTGNTNCLTCTPGTYQNDVGQTGCILCPNRTAISLGSADACALCEPGKFSDEEGLVVCKSCALGSYSSGVGAFECTPCPLGQISSSEGATACKSCEGGFFAGELGLDECDRCPVGFYQDEVGQSACKACPLGTASNIEVVLQCRDCEPGFVANLTNMTSCVSCAAGFYQELSGQSECLACPIGKYGPGGASCELCPPGQYNDLLGQLTCGQCPPGTFQDTYGNDTCKNCAVGSFGQAAGSIQCDLCDPGRFSNDTGTQDCMDCLAGTYNGVSGAAECTDCQRGRYTTSVGQLRCTRCATGRYNPDYGRGSTCIPCEAGTSQSLIGQQSCDMCSVGKFYAGTGAIECTDCHAGTYINETGVTECLPCPVGSAIATTGNVACDRCDLGTFVGAVGATACIDCARGRYGNITGLSDCTDCPRGSAQDFEGQAVCQLCALGRFVDAEAQTDCIACLPGTYEDDLGSTECKSCTPGTYASFEGQSACDGCPEGRFSNSQSALSCFECPQGTFANVTGLAICFDCAAGHYQDRTQQESCQQCAPGKFQSATGQFDCRSCDPGEYTSGYGSVTCQECPAGRAQANENSVACSLCAAGKYSFAGADECTSCTQGQVAPEVGATECIVCDENAQTDDTNIDCFCNVGYAAVFTNNSAGEPITRCDECPEGAVCDFVGVIWTEMATEEGYWEAATGEYYTCLFQSHCPGGSDSTTACAPFRDGPLCANCMDGYSESVSGECEPCEDSEASIFFTGSAVLVAAGVLFANYWFLVYSNTNLVNAAVFEDKRRALEEKEYFQAKEQAELNGTPLPNKKTRLLANDYGSADMEGLARYVGPLTIFGPPPPSPDYVFKLKIMLGFVQIVTNVSSSLEIRWPQLFVDFLYNFNPANLDFVQFTNVDCLNTGVDYVTKIYAWAIVVPVIVLSIFLFYLLPIWVRYFRSNEKDKVERTKRMRQFKRLIYFTLFLVYPSVSTTCFNYFVCVKVQDTYYLRTDFTVQCYTDYWRSHEFQVALLCVIYPIGIPALFLYMLWKMRYPRNKLDLRSVRAQMGFLYDGYKREMWFFELMDMSHKLALTSLIAFLPLDYQMPAAMIVIWIYMTIIYLGQPYIRKGDDRLHLAAQCELLLLMLSAHIFNNVTEINQSTEDVLAVTLIGLVIGFVGWWVTTMLSVIAKKVKSSKVCGACVSHDKVDEEELAEKADAIMDRKDITPKDKLLEIRKMRAQEQIKITLSKKQRFMLEVLGDENIDMLIINRDQVGRNEYFKQIQERDRLKSKKEQRLERQKAHRKAQREMLMKKGFLSKLNDIGVVDDLTELQLHYLLNDVDSDEELKAEEHPALPPPPIDQAANRPWNCVYREPPPNPKAAQEYDRWLRDNLLSRVQELQAERDRLEGKQRKKSRKEQEMMVVGLTDVQMRQHQLKLVALEKKVRELKIREETRMALAEAEARKRAVDRIKLRELQEKQAIVEKKEQQAKELERRKKLMREKARRIAAKKAAEKKAEQQSFTDSVLAVVAKTQDEKAAAAVANVTDPAESARERAEVERKRVELERRKKAYLAKKQADALARTEAAASKTPGKKDSKQRQLVVAKAGYASKEETKLSFGPRDIVRVISTKNGNWHYGVLLRSSTHPVGSKGYYPPNYFIPMPTKKSAGGHG
jgi:hypothetical protein